MSSRGIFFHAPWGRMLVALSIICTFVTLSLALLLATGGLARQPVLSLILVAFTLGCIPFAVRGYTIDGGTLFIHRIGWKTRIPLDDLQSAIADSSLIDGSYRMFGTGGFYSFTGTFSSPKLGRYRAYFTDSSKAVVLTFPKRKIVVSPDRPGEFAAALSRTISAS
ncbi:hypothetical protein DB345_03065 [Spartobacteria bacterium LR76]|nr:hypothetical protein DB345_03065 [Spartobacteria bacterium LR76]